MSAPALAASADVAITINGPANTTVGQSLTYTITVTNNGPDDASNVILNDTLAPNNLTLVSLSKPAGWTCSTLPIFVGCSTASVASGTSLVFTIVAQVTGGIVSPFFNQPLIFSTTPDPHQSNNRASVMTTVGNAQSITFGAQAPRTFASNGTFAISPLATSTSGLPITYSSLTTGICTVSGTTVTMVSVGTCSLAANQAGNGNFSPVPQVTQEVVIGEVAVTVALTASATSALLGQPVTFTATTTPTPQGGTITFSDGVTALCSNVVNAGGTATCSASFSTTGMRAVFARYGGSANDAVAVSAAVNVAVTDQTGRTAQVIGRFLGQRNNQILTNGPDQGRQIDRLMDADREGSSSDTGSGFASAFSGGAGLSQSGDVASRLGDGPDGGAFSRLAFGKRSGTFGRPGNNPFAGIAVNYPTDDDVAQPSPIRVTGSSEGAMSLGFGTSLRDFYRFAAGAEARKADGILSGFSSSEQPQFNPFDIWIEGKYVRFNDSAFKLSDLDGHVGLVTVGADYVLNRNLLVGAFVQFDNMQQRSDIHGTDVSGHGWMTGPYATVRLSENVFWQLRAAWGMSSNTISPFFSYSDSFDSNRWLASSTITGRWNFGPWTFKPSTSVSYIEDSSQFYHDAFSVPIPGVTSTLGQAKVGPEISYTFTSANGGLVEPHVAAQLIWNFAGDTTTAALGVIDENAAGPKGLRSRVDVGLKMSTPSGVALDLSGSYDGIGTSGAYNAISGRAIWHIPFD